MFNYETLGGLERFEGEVPREKSTEKNGLCGPKAERTGASH